MKHRRVGFARLQRVVDAFDEKPVDLSRSVTEPSAVGKDQEPELWRWTVEIADLRRNRLPFRSPEQNRDWPVMLISNQNVRSQNRWVGFKDEEIEIALRVAMGPAGGPEIANLLQLVGRAKDFDDNGAFAQIAHSVSLSPRSDCVGLVTLAPSDRRRRRIQAIYRGPRRSARERRKV